MIKITPIPCAGSDARNPSIKNVADTTTSSSSFTPSKMELLRSKLKTGLTSTAQRGGEFGDAAVVATSLDTVKDQLKYLKAAVESSLELSKKKHSGGAVLPADHEAAVAEADLQVELKRNFFSLLFIRNNFIQNAAALSKRFSFLGKHSA